MCWSTRGVWGSFAQPFWNQLRPRRGGLGGGADHHLEGSKRRRFDGAAQVGLQLPKADSGFNLFRWAKAQRAVSQKAREDTIRALVAGFQDESVQPLLSSPSSTSKEESSRSLFLENANQALFPTSSRRDSTQSFPSTAFMTPEQVKTQI